MLRLLEDTSKAGKDLLSPEFWKENFGRLAELSVSFSANDQRRASIYGNSSGSVEILVNIKILGRGSNSNTPINLSADFLRECVGLCSYSTGSDVLYGTDKPANKGWFYRTRNRVDIHWDFDFISAVDYAPQLAELQSVGEPLDARDVQLTQYALYLSAGNAAELQSFSAWIDIPGIGKFNCSKVSTDTPNSNPEDSRPGTPFKTQSLLSVLALKPLDYSDAENISTVNRWHAPDWISPVTDVAIKTNVGGIYKHNGKFSYNAHSMLIKPARSSRFVHRKLYHATGGEINTMQWSSPPAIFRGVGGMNYDLSAIFVDTNFSGVYGGSQFHLGPSLNWFKYYYFIGPNDGRFVRESPEYTSEEYIKVDIRNFGFTDWGKYVLAAGTLTSNSAYITVHDEFGNSGDITLSTRDNNWPYLYVNGQ